MDWKERRRSQGWKQQLIWLKPECVEILNRWKESSGKSYQAIINELIANYEQPVESEQADLERRILAQVENIVEERLREIRQKEAEQENTQKEEEAEQTQGTETIQFELPEDLQGMDRSRILNLIKEMHEKEGRSFQDIAEQLNSQGIKTILKKE